MHPLTALDQNRRVPTVHAIDLENEVIASGQKVTTADVTRWWSTYRQEAVGVGPDDLVFVAVSVRTAREFRPTFAGEKVMWRVGHGGPDGADLALLASIYAPHVARRYRRLVIASGDHIFAPLAREARDLGMQVQVVAGQGRVSAELAEAASIRTTIRTVSRSQQARTLAAIHLVRSATVAA